MNDVMEEKTLFIIAITAKIKCLGINIARNIQGLCEKF